jgi:hypothetical protein
VFLSVGSVGLALVAGVFFAAAISTAIDEHAAPVLVVFLTVGLLLIASADLVAQAVVALVNATLLRPRRR